ncbi:MAG: (d)CMP kinase [Luteibaculaceae bacterium]
MKKINIAIDGYSSCGKSTVAKSLAKNLGYIYVDSGAMYRAVTLYAQQNHFILDGVVDAEKLTQALPLIEIDFDLKPGCGSQQTWLNGTLVEDKIRELSVSRQVSEVSKIPAVREKLVAMQQKIAEKKGVVMDGRDIGTVVLPNAELKIFMTADIETRTERRYKELLQKGESITLQQVEENLKHRDFQDANRAVSPLRQAEDAKLLDNTKLNHEEQFQVIQNWVNNLVNVSV